MQDHHNGLTPAEAERIAMLAEECAEVTKICMKILRFGKDDYHPEDPMKTKNITRLISEMNDVYAVEWMMELAGDIDDNSLFVASDKLHRKLKYSFHQQEVKEGMTYV